MKYIKTYEIISHFSKINKNDLEVGDYVVLKMWDHPNDKLVNFVNNNVGQITDITSLNINVKIEYENVPDTIRQHFSICKNNKFMRPFHTNEIKYYSKNKKELELSIAANKYNL
jgi:hypothetical protein